MSDQRTHRWGSGRLISTSVIDFWQISRTVQDPSIPNLPLETAATVASNPAIRSLSASPQQVAHRAVSGFGVIFAAAAALLSAPPASDAVGATNYTVGSHRAAIAAAAPRPIVFKTPTVLIPVAAVEYQPTAKVITKPQAASQPQPYVHGTPPPPELYSVQRATTRPQTPPQLAPYVHGGPETPAPVVTTDPTWRTISASGQVVDQRQPGIWGRFVVESVAAADTPLTAFRSAGPQPPPLIAPYVRGTAPDSLDLSLSKNYVAEQDVWQHPQPRFFGNPVNVPAAGTDVPLLRTIYSAPQYPKDGTAHVWGAAPDNVVALDSPQLQTRFSAPQQVQSGSAKVIGGDLSLHLVPPVPHAFSARQDVWQPVQPAFWGKPVVEIVIGTDTPIGVFRFTYDATSLPIQYGAIQRMDVDAIGPAPVEVQQVRRGGGRPNRPPYTAKKPRRLNQEIVDLVESVSAEMAYKAVVATAPLSIKQEAAEVIQPYTETAVDAVDWAALEADARAIGELLRLWSAEQARLKRIRDDDEWLMWED